MQCAIASSDMNCRQMIVIGLHHFNANPHPEADHANTNSYAVTNSPFYVWTYGGHHGRFRLFPATMTISERSMTSFSNDQVPINTHKSSPYFHHNIQCKEPYHFSVQLRRDNRSSSSLTSRHITSSFHLMKKLGSFCLKNNEVGTSSAELNINMHTIKKL